MERPHNEILRGHFPNSVERARTDDLILLARSARPVVALKWGSREPGSIDKIGIGKFVPTELNRHGCHAFGFDNYSFTINLGGGFDERAVGTGDFEFVQGFAVP